MARSQRSKIRNRKQTQADFHIEALQHANATGNTRAAEYLRGLIRAGKVPA